MTPRSKAEVEAEAQLEAKQKALKLREMLKHKLPDFVRQESWRYKRIKENWRRPRGIDSKMRRKIKGWPKCPEAGYRGPKAARGLHPSGYEEILVYNPDDLDRIDPKTQAARIAHTVGIKKRMEIIAKATSKGIKILNPKEAELEIKEEKAEEEISETEKVEVEKGEEKTEEIKEEKKEKPKTKKKRATRRKKKETAKKTRKRKKSGEGEE